MMGGGGWGGIGYEGVGDQQLRCFDCGARAVTRSDMHHLPNCRNAPHPVKPTGSDDDSIVTDVIVAAAVDTLMSSGFSSDSSIDTSTPDTGSDFGGFDGGDSGGGGASGDF